MSNQYHLTTEYSHPEIIKQLTQISLQNISNRNFIIAPESDYIQTFVELTKNPNEEKSNIYIKTLRNPNPQGKNLEPDLEQLLGSINAKELTNTE